MVRVREVFDVVHDLVGDYPRREVDGVLGVWGRVGCLKRLLTPERFTTGRLAADVHREHLQEDVGVVVAAAQGKKEGLEDAVS